MLAGYTDVASQVGRCCSNGIQRKNKRRPIVITECNGRRSISGLQHCKRVPCPICAPFLEAKRLQALQPALDRATSNPGIRLFSLVLTLKHSKADPWLVLVSTLKAAQRQLVQGNPWRNAVLGWIRQLESTYGRYGHHPHLHLIIAINPEVDSKKFFDWVESKCSAVFEGMGRESKWAQGWYRPIHADDLTKEVGYLGAIGKVAAVPNQKKHTPLWLLPPGAFAEIYTDSKGLHWFDVGGIFAKSTIDKQTSLSGANPEVERVTIGWMSPSKWSRWTKEGDDLLEVVADWRIDREAFLSVWVSAGGHAGFPPDVVPEE